MKMAVYGTLRGGLPNHSYVKNHKFLGTGKTVEKYTMRASGIPYVGKEPRTRIDVEVYDVTGKTEIEAIDRLEGHPHWYKREEIEVELNDGRILKAWLYFMESTSKIIETGNYLDCNGYRERSEHYWISRRSQEDRENIVNNEAF
jgi:gamma-glutamylaminecyclotransferase